VNNGVPTDLLALLVGMACGLVLGWVYCRAWNRHLKQARRRTWLQGDSILARRMRGYTDAEWS